MCSLDFLRIKSPFKNGNAYYMCMLMPCIKNRLYIKHATAQINIRLGI